MEGRKRSSVAPWLETALDGAAELTADDVIIAAHEIEHEAGYGGLTVRALSARLGVGTTVIYRHIVNKQVLQLAIVDRVLSEVDTARVATKSGEPRWVGSLRGTIEQCWKTTKPGGRIATPTRASCRGDHR